MYAYRTVARASSPPITGQDADAAKLSGHDGDKVSHGFFLGDGKRAAVFAGKTKCARGAAIEIQLARNFEIIDQRRFGKNSCQLGERDFRANAERHAIIPSGCDKGPRRE